MHIFVLIVIACGIQFTTTAQGIPFNESVLEPEMVLIPSGNFRMGSQLNRAEQPVHEVHIDSFYMSKFEITYEQFDQFARLTGMQQRNDMGWGRGNRPVVDVSWDDAAAYVNWLAQQTGKPYRLPTESEWEYAARSGSTTEYPWGDEIGTGNANCRECGSEWDGKSSAVVGSFPPNEFGLYDMHGNVNEWVQDCFLINYVDAPIDGSSRENCDEIKGTNPDDEFYVDSRVMRGGSWDSSAFSTRSAKSSAARRDYAYSDIGIRVVMESAVSNNE